MFCSKCGMELKEGAAFCANCGAAVNPVQPVAPVTPAESVAPVASVAPTEAVAAPIETAATGIPVQTVQAPIPAAPAETGGKKKKKEKTPGKKKGKGALVAVILLLVLLIGAGVGGALYFTGDSYKSQKNLKLANECYEEGEYEDALDYYEEARELDDMLLETYLNPADIYLRDGDYEEAISLLKDAIKIFKKADEEDALEELTDMLTEAYLAGIEEEKGADNFDEARKLAGKALKDTGDKVFSKKQVEIYAAEADHYVQSDRFENALEVLETGYAETDDDSLLEKRVEVFDQAADRYLRDDGYDFALSWLTWGYYATGDSGLMERTVEVYLEYAEIYVAQQDYDMAIQILSAGQDFTGAEKLGFRMDELIAERKPQPVPGGGSAGVSGGNAGGSGFEDPYYVYRDPATGQPYDFGGMEVIIRDWYHEDREPRTEYEDNLQSYREWLQETYNFSVREVAIGDWGSNYNDYLDYVMSGGDDNNYVFCLHPGSEAQIYMLIGLMYDLSRLNCLDFTEEKFLTNKVHEKYAYGNSIYAMSAVVPTSGGGMYFNKRVLEKAGIDPEDIYDMQASGTWTWDAWEEIMARVMGAGYYGTVWSEASLAQYAVWSNGGEFVGRDNNGHYTYRLEDDATIQALEWAEAMLDSYGRPVRSGETWDYYFTAFKNGEAAFMPEYSYKMTWDGDSGLQDMEDDFGFVMFPKGPQAEDYTYCLNENLMVIPACYDEDRAWKTAFIWNVYTDAVPGYDDSFEAHVYDYYTSARDIRAVEETLWMMRKRGVVTYNDMIPGFDIGNLVWASFDNTNVSSVINANRDVWKAAIAEANAR